MNKDNFGVYNPSKPEHLKECLEAIEQKDNPYFICVVDFSENKNGVFLSTVKGNREIILQMILKLSEYL